MKKQEIENALSKIREERRSGKKKKTENGDQAASNKRESTAVTKEKKLKVGWLHRDHERSKFTQVRKTGGDTIRQITYSNEANVTVDFIRNAAIKMFFPEGKSIYGAIEEMSAKIGNYDREEIENFKDTDGNVCCYSDYLKSRGLYASRSYVYLMTSRLMKEDGDMEHSGEEGEESHNSTEEEKMAEIIEVKEMTQEPTKKENCLDTPVPVFAVYANGCNSIDIKENIIDIVYEEKKESSFSEVICTSLTNNRKECYTFQSMLDPTIQDTDIYDYDPQDHGFKVVGIRKGELSYLTKTCLELPESIEAEEVFQFPQSTAENSNNIILHSPSDVWGYDSSDNTLLLCVIAPCLQEGVYTWYIDNEILVQRRGLFCLVVKRQGVYKVEVCSPGKGKEMSKPVKVEEFKEEPTQEINSKMPTTIQELPLIDILQDVKYNKKDEIGRGAYGVVYKGVWAGTPVAIKEIKLRNARAMESVIKTEVQVHYMLRHPNIIQIMAISLLKNSVYVISEMVDGFNLDEVLFCDEGSEAHNHRENLLKCKVFIGKQICQAVAYMHQLSPPVIHRDLKPGNILVNKITAVTKICDMGLSKLKTRVATTQTNGIMGTPQYLAPECLIERKTGTLHSDIWSLGCTLIELFTEKDCWEDEKLGFCSDDIETILKRKQSPSRLPSLPSIITGCFDYCPIERPSAIDILDSPLFCE